VCKEIKELLKVKEKKFSSNKIKNGFSFVIDTTFINATGPYLFISNIMPLENLVYIVFYITLL